MWLGAIHELPYLPEEALHETLIAKDAWIEAVLSSNLMFST